MKKPMLADHLTQEDFAPGQYFADMRAYNHQVQWDRVLDAYRGANNFDEFMEGLEFHNVEFNEGQAIDYWNELNCDQSK